MRLSLATFVALTLLLLHEPGSERRSFAQPVEQTESTKHEALIQTFPDPEWQSAGAADLGMSDQRLRAASRYAQSGGGAGMIIRHGKVAHSWGDTRRKFDLKSTSKSIGVTALGLAIDDGKLTLDDLASRRHPSFGLPPKSNSQNGWLDRITLRHLATHSAGFEKPGGYTKLLFEPGTRWHYSDGGPNWLAECVTLAMEQDIESLMFQRVLTPIGVTKDDLHWRRHQYRAPKIGQLRRCEFGSGVHANVDAMARIGLLYLREGSWQGRQLLSGRFIALASHTESKLSGLKDWDDAHGDASEHYGLLWWNNADGALDGVPSDAFWSWGLYDSLIVVIPSLDIVVARAGKSWKRSPGQNHYDVLAPFLHPIVASTHQDVSKASKRTQNSPVKIGPVKTGGAQSSPGKTDHSSLAPYPPSRLASTIRWAPRDSIVRLAKGSDNWPITWMDDDSLMTAYGDGWGFEPKVAEKLSLGFARVSGSPNEPRGINVRSPTGEKLGQGVQGIKASGLLMVDGVLYLLARNADHSQLAWSTDRGLTWTWCDWKFRTSFGCPTFLNFGRDYDGAPDHWVYLVSPDSPSAYEPADRMVMARVPVDSLRDRDAYQYFVSSNDEGGVRWSQDVRQRGAVFEHPGRCYRGGMTYNAGLQRYLWCQTLPDSTHPQGPRFQGGFGIYDAPQPWGPWTTLYFTNDWDVGPGESSVIPTKWISRDGRTIHLVFSGDDCFSVRRGILVDLVLCQR